MENENLAPENQDVIQKTQSQLHSVTPLSKYLAMGLFVILPFLGGWIGYTYAPEKIVEIEKVLIKEVSMDSSSQTQSQQSVNESEIVTNDSYGFSFEKPASWLLEIKTENNGWHDYVLTPSEQTDSSENIKISISSNVFEGAATIPAELFDLQIPQSWPLISQRLVCEPSDDELPAGFTRTEENLQKFCEENTRLVTIFTDIDVSDNFVWSINARYDSENDQMFEKAIVDLVSSFETATEAVFNEHTGEFTGYYISLEMNPDEVNGYLEEGETVNCDAFVITEGATDILQTFGDDKSLIPTSITRLTDTVLISKHVVSESDMQKLKESSESNQVNVSITEVFEGDKGVDTCEATIESLQVL